MNLDESGARIGHQGTAMSRAKKLALKALLIVGGVVTLASAFVLSLAFLAIGLAVVLFAGAYLWWQTRELRRQMRARIQPQPDGRIIEGEVISREQTRR
jgi:protein-S-isoprenylcysteine O-methyltransferase Ste14